MIATGAVACANARVRAMKSRLLGHEIAGRVIAGLGVTHNEPPDRGRGFDELIDWYVVVLKGYPRGRALLLALLRRHELENIKLIWRVIVNSETASGWQSLWIDLAPLATISLDACRDCRTLSNLVDALRRTPYASIARDMWRAHAADPAAAELGFDRWASRCIVDAAADLPKADRTAVALAHAVVREREVNIAYRFREGGLPLPAVTVPRAWQGQAPAAADHDRWVVWLRRRRKQLCRQAFLETPFCLAPAVALLLLKEEEIRGLEAIAWFDARSSDPAWLAFALAASELGA